MKRRFTLITAAVMLLTMITPSLEVKGQTKTTTTYQHVFNAKPSTGNNITLSSVQWNISATNLGSYNSGNYAGVQFGTSTKTGQITLTSSSAWGNPATPVAYYGKTKITEVRVWLNKGGGTVTPTVTIGGVSATSDGTVVAKNSSAGNNWQLTSCVTFTPATNGDSGVVVIDVTSTAAGYICCIQIDCEEPGGGSTPSISANDVNIAYDATNGSIAYTLNNATGNVSASVTTGDWLTLGEITASAVPFTCSANTGAERTSTVTLSFTGADDKIVTVTQAAKPTYTVTYYPNGSTGGSVPTDANTYPAGSTVTVLDNTGSLVKTGYSFSHWNTKANGSGTSYNPGETFSISANTSLFAQWAPNTHDITLPSNNTYGSYSTDATTDVAFNTVVILTYTPNGGYEDYDATWRVNGTAIIGNTFLMPDNDVTITATVAPYKWIETPLANLTTSDVFVIVGNNGSCYAMSNDNGTGNAPDAIGVTISDDKISSHVVDRIKWNISGNASDGYTFYPNGDNTKWLYCTNTNNGVRVGTNANKTFKMVNEYLQHQGTSRYVGVYSSSDWRCYTDYTTANIKDQTFAFYRRVPYMTVEGYGSGSGKWKFIASPIIENISPTVVTNLLGSDIDLYRFNQSADNEWENYENVAHTAGFMLVNGEGYLYGNKSDATLIFTTGNINGNATKTVNLEYDGSADLPGVNLVGNPFAVAAYADKSYYTMNAAGTGLVADALSTASPIDPCTGVIVIASGTGQSVTFNTSAPGASSSAKNGVLQIALAQANEKGGVSTGSTTAMDNAILSFNEGDELGKFVFNKDNAKIYFTQNGKDYAITHSDAEGEMPLNFKAGENGTYTLSFEVENTEMTYLHLIDKLTGNDIDLLATPEYTFSAKSGDSENRFRLVFEANGNALVTSNEPFAYFNGSEWVIENDGNATLQVIDVMGRMLRSVTVSGNATTSLPNLSAGVYVLRLVNSESIRTQKVVIE